MAGPWTRGMVGNAAGDGVLLRGGGGGAAVGTVAAVAVGSSSTDGADVVVVEVRRCVKTLIVSAEMAIKQSLGETMAMAWSMAEQTSGSRSPMLSGVSRAPSVEAEEEDDGGIACVEVAEASFEWLNSSKASESSSSRADVADAGDLTRSGASRWRWRCCVVDVEDVAEVLGTRGC